MSTQRKILILSVGYGMGHHAAAWAVSEELQKRGFSVSCIDPCECAHPILYAATRRFYHFCVRRAPWLWGVTYEQTDNSDWASMLHLPGLAACVSHTRRLLEEYEPEACVCTYPLFAHILDAINAQRSMPIPYALVVTDALEISRPWATSNAPLICVPDACSRRLLMYRYGIAPQRIEATGFPVRSAFSRTTGTTAPTARNLRLLYGAFAPLERVRRDVRALMFAYPDAQLVLVAGERKNALQQLANEFQGRLSLLGSVPDMQPLFAGAHIYIGKAGAATMFEAYASRLPLIINYALPGQEQGNLELMLADGCGLYAESTADLLRCIASLLEADAARWRACSANMALHNRACGAENIADEMERRFL